MESLREKSPTLRATANRQGRLRIAVWEDVPFMYFRDPTTGERSGFEIEIAEALGKELGYSEDRIEWITIENLPDRLSILGEGRADMVVASFSMTEEREKFVDFGGPYMLVPQAVMVRSNREKRIERSVTCAVLTYGSVRQMGPLQSGLWQTRESRRTWRKPTRSAWLGCGQVITMPSVPTFQFSRVSNQRMTWPPTRKGLRFLTWQSPTRARR